MLLGAWREDETLRHDVSLAWDAVRRQSAIVVSTTATLLAGAILCFAIVHIITD